MGQLGNGIWVLSLVFNILFLHKKANAFIETHVT